MRATGMLALLVATVLAGSCGRAGSERATDADRHHDEHDGEHDVAAERGPHGGRIFESDGLRLELWIAESGIPPEFRAQLTDATGRALDPAGTRAWVVLERFGGRRDSLHLETRGDHLRSVREVVEPHSYRAQIYLERDGARRNWSFEQHEGRVELVPEAVVAGGIEVGTAGPERIQVHVEAPGEVRLNADRVVQVRPRYPGIVRRMERQLGDHVTTGDLLAVIHGDENLAEFEIRASMPGTVVRRSAAPGEAVGRETVLYTVADLSAVWVDLALYPQHVSKVQLGQEVIIRVGTDPDLTARGRIQYVGPLLEQDTRISYARVVLPNTGGRWKPGLFVQGEIVVETVTPPVAVPDEALVRMGDGAAVFRADGSTFEAQPVRTGRSDGRFVEILDGLESGARVVVRNAFLLKAELGKSGATHDH